MLRQMMENRRFTLILLALAAVLAIGLPILATSGFGQKKFQPRLVCMDGVSMPNGDCQPVN
jgi:hypothetical protein